MAENKIRGGALLARALKDKELVKFLLLREVFVIQQLKDLLSVKLK